MLSRSNRSDAPQDPDNRLLHQPAAQRGAVVSEFFDVGYDFPILHRRREIKQRLPELEQMA